MFLNLNVHSHYSLLSSLLSVDDIISFSLKNNVPYAAITDINTLAGAADFFLKCKENKIKPIIGLEIFYKNQKLILIAKNNIGYRNLMKISSSVLSEKEYELQNLLDGIILISYSPDIGSEFNLKEGKDFFIANQSSKNRIAVQTANYLDKNDFYIPKLLELIKNDQTIDSIDDLKKSVENNFEYLLTEKEAQKKFDSLSLKNLENVINSCDIDLEELKTSMIQYPSLKKMKTKDYLNSLCLDGLKKRVGKVVKKTYIERLNHELEIINKMGFNDYFLIVWDFINYAKKNNILIGPGRGSAAGSLVAYVLNITDIDPISNNLFFERFLNFERQSLPDIDIDVMDTRREEIINYLFKKYSPEKVAYIGTYQKLKAKSAIRDVGRVLKVPLKDINDITKTVPAEYDEDLLTAIDKVPEFKAKSFLYLDLIKIAQKLINLPRQASTHAAGIVLSNCLLTDIIPVQKGINNFSQTQFSMEYLEYFGLIKIDILGLRNLTVIDNILKQISKSQNKYIDLAQIPKNDFKTFLTISKKETAGIFQLESEGMSNLCEKFKPRTIEDISIISALYRPGPMRNIPEFLKRRNKLKQPSYINDEIKNILEPTEGIIVYQEQVIQIVQKIANFSGAKADLFRRAISKKKIEELKKMKNDFITSSINNGYSETDVTKIYEYINNFGDYGFNHSHSYAYSLLSYQMAYLKTYYPAEFFSSLLSSLDSTNPKFKYYIKELNKFNLKILLPSINDSEVYFKVEKKYLRFGFNCIKGLGPEGVKKVLLVRNSFSDKKFPSLEIAFKELIVNGINKSQMESLIYSGCFDTLEKNRLLSLEILKQAIEYSQYSKITNLIKKTKDYSFDETFLIDANKIDKKKVFLTKDNVQFLKEKESEVLGFDFLKNH